MLLENDQSSRWQRNVSKRIERATKKKCIEMNRKSNARIRTQNLSGWSCMRLPNMELVKNWEARGTGPARHREPVSRNPHRGGEGGNDGRCQRDCFMNKKKKYDSKTCGQWNCQTGCILLSRDDDEGDAWSDTKLSRINHIIFWLIQMQNSLQFFLSRTSPYLWLLFSVSTKSCRFD